MSSAKSATRGRLWWRRRIRSLRSRRRPRNNSTDLGNSMNIARCLVSMVLGAALMMGCDDKKAQPSNVNKTPAEPAAAFSGKPGDGIASGKAVFVGVAPKPLPISMVANAACAAMHANPVFEETIVVGANNELKNVVVYVKDGGKLGGAVPTVPVMLDQVGCVYTPHV